MITKIATDVLVVGGGTGGSAAAIQAARRGAKTVLVSQFPWLGGMLTSAGVGAPDGNELAAWQTGLWGAYLRQLQQQQAGGLNHGWVSMFTYQPVTGASIFAAWERNLPNLSWIQGKAPQEVLRRENRIVGVRFEDLIVEANITIDGTELGDLLAQGSIPHRWGWELQEEFGEASAPESENQITTEYPVQVPTWVFLLQDYGISNSAPQISKFSDNTSCFQSAWDNHGKEQFLNYGRLPGERFMINWPLHGNDYGRNLGRLIESTPARREFLQEAYEHSCNFAAFVQEHLGKRYGLATNNFPHSLGNGAFALSPYFRESRRLRGMETLKEQDILPLSGGCVAKLPTTATGEVSAIAIGNYPNDHHYPGVEFPLQPKSLAWGGRWTGTPFTIPYGALIPEAIDGFLVCEKNISVSHIANGSSRLQPVVMNLGQAAGMAAALCIERGCQPRNLPVRELQEALLNDTLAPAAVIPLLNLSPDHPQWLKWQRYYLEHPEAYPNDGNCPCSDYSPQIREFGSAYRGILEVESATDYQLLCGGKSYRLVTLRPDVHQKLASCDTGKKLTILGYLNSGAQWLVVKKVGD